MVTAKVKFRRISAFASAKLLPSAHFGMLREKSAPAHTLFFYPEPDHLSVAPYIAPILSRNVSAK